MPVTMLRAFMLVTLTALSLAACGGSGACEPGTLYASLTFDDRARTADTLRVRSTINGASIAAEEPYTGQTQVRVPFAGVAYAEGLTVEVVVEARLNGGIVATASMAGYVLPKSCAVLPLTFDDASTSFSLSGMATGVEGMGLVVSDGVDSVSVTTSGPIVFPTKISSGQQYDVIVTTSPTHPTETCNVMNGTGYIDDVDISNVVVACSPGYYTIGGFVSNLMSPTLIVELDGSQDVTLSQFGTSYKFTQPVQSGTMYTVHITQQPNTQECAFNSSMTDTVTGTVVDANIIDLDITCNSI